MKTRCLSLVKTPLINKALNAHWSETTKYHINTAFEYAISRVKVYDRQLILHGKHQLLIYAYYSNFWVKRAITTIKKTTDALLVASHKVGLEVNVEETKYKFISYEQNVGKYVCRHKANDSLRSAYGMSVFWNVAVFDSKSLEKLYLLH